MKGLFIPGITAEMFRKGCLESIEALMAEGEIHDIEYSRWIPMAERQPEDGQAVLCQCRAGIYEVLRWDEDHGWIDNGMDGYLPSFVVAWRELPESYGGEEV